MTTLRTVPQLGIWPFDSEKDKNLSQAVDAAAMAIRKRVQPQLSALQESTWFLVDLYRNPWTDFVKNYMAVARAVGSAYRVNMAYYTTWEPRLIAMGWQKDILAKLMTAMRELGNAGVIPIEVFDPAHNEAPGSDGSPIGAFGKVLEGTFLKTAAIVVIGLVGYGYLVTPRLPRRRA